MIDSALVTVQIGAAPSWRKRKSSAAQQTRILYYADAIRQHFTPPASLGEIPTLAYDTLQGNKNDKRVDGDSRGVVSGHLVLVVTPVGRLKLQAWEATPLSVTFANAVTAAVLAADSSGAFDGMPPAGKGERDTLVLAIHSRRAPVAIEPVLMRARIAVYTASSSAQVVHKAKVEYPESARQNNAENDGMVSFVVGSDGRAVASSVQVTRTDYSDFIETMRGAVVASTYSAATSGGCRVPQLVSQPIEFGLRRY